MATSPFQLGLRPVEPAAFFGPWPEDGTQHAERRRRWREDPAGAIVWDQRARPALAEFLERLADWIPTLAPALADVPPPDEGRAALVALGRRIVPDFVVLGPSGEPGDPRPVVLAGCVRFPSRWRIADKFLRPLSEVHGPVPGLNDTLGPTMDRLLAGMPPGKCLGRDNWGVCSVPEFDQHPERPLPPVVSPLRPGQVWLRREDQLLMRLPETGAMLFGIRVSHRRWETLCDDPELAIRVREELSSHTPEMLAYKQIDRVRDELVALLEPRG